LTAWQLKTIAFVITIFTSFWFYSEKHNHSNIAHDDELQEEPQEDLMISGDRKENDDELIKVRPLTRQ